MTHTRSAKRARARACRDCGDANAPWFVGVAEHGGELYVLVQDHSSAPGEAEPFRLCGTCWARLEMRGLEAGSHHGGADAAKRREAREMG